MDPLARTLSVVADAAEQAVGDTRSAAGTAGDFGGSGTIDGHAQDFGGTFDDNAEVSWV